MEEASIKTGTAKDPAHKWVVIISIVIPVLVAILFKVQIKGYDFSFLPPIYATINGSNGRAIDRSSHGNKKPKTTAARRPDQSMYGIVSVVFNDVCCLSHDERANGFWRNRLDKKSVFFHSYHAHFSLRRCYSASAFYVFAGMEKGLQTPPEIGKNCISNLAICSDNWRNCVLDD